MSDPFFKFFNRAIELHNCKEEASRFSHIFVKGCEDLLKKVEKEPENFETNARQKKEARCFQRASMGSAGFCSRGERF